MERLRAADPATIPRMETRAEALGRQLSTRRVNLLSGGGGGMMLAVCRGFASSTSRIGKVIGVIPGPLPREGYPNSFVEILIRTHLPGHDPLAETSRNHINVLSSDAVIALPGGPGTSAEVELARRYQRPVCVFLGKEDLIGGKDGNEWAADGIPWFSEFDQLSDWLDSKLSCQADVQEG